MNNLCHKCGLPFGPKEFFITADANIGACAAGAGNWVKYHQRCSPMMFCGPSFGPTPTDVRNAALEDAAQVLDRIVASMAAHTNQDGLVTGEDFHHPEIDYLRDAAKDVRALKETRTK